MTPMASELWTDELARGRKREGFMDRLRQRIEEDKPILDKLEALEHTEKDAVVEAVVAEIRRLEAHECRYPTKNNRGFPTSQCLDCGRWDGGDDTDG